MSDVPIASSNDEQIGYWNAMAGPVWARHQQQLDRQLAPLGAEAMRVLAPASGEHIVDIGCGCGDSALQLAAHVGRGGSVVGVDISEPMLDVARRRLPPDGAVQPEFRRLDAQTDDLGRQVFDAVFSRFGVMFFSNPVVAFGNIRAALQPQGRLTFVCWRPLPDNPWMAAPMAAAAPLLPPAPPMDPIAPGPFAFADDARVRFILQSAGFADVRISPFDTRIGGGGLEDTVNLTLGVGPLGRVLRDHVRLVDAVAGAVREAIRSFETPQGVLMPAAVWVVSARNG